MCAITYNRKFVRLDLLGDKTDNDNKVIKKEGIYMFGGVFGATPQNHTVNGKLYIFPIGANVIHRWGEVETKGTPAEARFQHSMNYYDRGNYIVVYGGKRLAQPQPNVHYESEFVNSIALLRMDTLEWF